MTIRRPHVRNDYSQNDLAKYLNNFLMDVEREVNALIDSYRLSNYTATTNPSINDDIGDGYKVGSTWLNTATNKWYFCNANTLGAANWVVIN